MKLNWRWFTVHLQSLCGSITGVFSWKKKKLCRIGSIQPPLNQICLILQGDIKYASGFYSTNDCISRLRICLFPCGIKMAPAIKIHATDSSRWNVLETWSHPLWILLDLNTPFKGFLFPWFEGPDFLMLDPNYLDPFTLWHSQIKNELCWVGITQFSLCSFKNHGFSGR